ncbi:serine/threonine protein kinase, partial [Streptomyces sp. NPDC004285]
TPAPTPPPEYRPPATRSAPSARRRQSQASTGDRLAEISRRRPRKTAAVAGAIAFVVFLIIGMAWLS